MTIDTSDEGTFCETIDIGFFNYDLRFTVPYSEESNCVQRLFSF
jgi:hypothetical protein